MYADSSSAGPPVRWHDSGWNEIFVCLLIAAGFFVLLCATPDLPGGFDAYRHVKQASRYLTEPHEVFTNTWSLPYFWPKPVDAWFGFHILLLPLTTIFPPITAIKLLASALLGGIAYTLFLILRHLGASHRTIWVLIALTGSSSALCRDTLTRPFLLSILLTLLALLFTLKQRPLALALVCAVHAASYSIFFLAALAPGIWLVLQRNRPAFRLAASAGAGVMAGLLLNPYFPENLRFDLVQASVTEIAARAHVEIGLELYPLSSWAFWTLSSLPVVSVWLVAVWFRIREARNAQADLLLAASAVTLLGTVRVGRTADFFVLFATLFAASVLTPKLAAWSRDLPYALAPMAIACGIHVWLTYAYVIAAPPLERYRNAAAYLRTHAPGELVANAKWADYQFLFFLNSSTRYVVGIEPTMLYMSDHRKYWLWRHMSDDETSTCGREQCQEGERTPIGQAMRAELGAGYIFLQHLDNPKLERALRAEAGVTEVYRDPGVSLYRLDGARDHSARSASAAN